MEVRVKDLYQWDLNVQVEITPDEGLTIDEVHFYNPYDDVAPVMELTISDDGVMVNIPNILLQYARDIYMYVVHNDKTISEYVHKVRPRQRPADYVYTETEVKSYAALEKRVLELEENGVTEEQIERAVKSYLDEKPIEVDLSDYATKKYVDDIIENLDIPSSEEIITEEQIVNAIEEYFKENPIVDNTFYANASMTSYEEIYNALADGKEVRVAPSPISKEFIYSLNEANQNKYIFLKLPTINTTGDQGSLESYIDVLVCENIENAPAYAQWSSYTMQLAEQSDVNEALSIAKGSNKAMSFSNYSSMIARLNSLSITELNTGQNIYIQTLNVPDLWVSDINPREPIQYTYTSDEDFVNELIANGSVRIGYYYLSALETQKVNLSEYAKSEDVPTKVSELENDSNFIFVDTKGEQGQALISNGDGTYSWGNVSSGGESNTKVYSITRNLENCTSSSSITSVVEGSSRTETLTPNDGYVLGTPIITMGGVDITSSVYDDGVITIASVTGDIVISCSCEAIVTGDTSPVIVQENVGFSSKMDINDFQGVCITKIYEFTPDIEGIKSSSYYDAENDYVTIGGMHGKINYVTPCIKMEEHGYSTTGITNNASKILQYRDGNPVAYYSNTSLTSSSSGYTEKSINFDRNKTDSMYSNGIAFTLSMLDVDDSYAYWYGDKNTILPIGVRLGDIIFAGKNTQYYGMANIDGTPAGSTASISELSLDDDIAMNYSIATTSLMGDELPSNTQSLYGINSEFASVIDTARKEWMTEYAGDYRKIPIIVSTDQHGRRNSGLFNMLGKVLNMHDVSKVMNLGDTTSTWYDADVTKPLLTDSTLDAWLDSIKAIPYSKRLDVFGNHDTWYGNYEDEGNTIGTRYPSTQAHLNQYFRNIYARRTNNNGWFVTYDDQFNVKYVVVSAFEYRGGVTFRIGTQQMSWLIDELSKNDGYDVVIVSHVPLYENPEYNIYPTGQTSTVVARISELDTDTLFSARKTKGSGTIVDSDGVEHNYDFSDCGSTLLCSLHGHTHYDAYLYLNDSLLVNAFDWFDDDTFFFVLIDRVNNQLNVWKVDNTPQYQNYQIPLDKPMEI